MTLQKGHVWNEEQISARAAKQRREAIERNRGNTVASCPKCGTQELVKWGIDRKGRFPRQRWMCTQKHLFLEPREYPFGERFQSEPYKLLDAARRMVSGMQTFQEIASSVGLDRYTIYKLHDHLGKSFFCECGRNLGHRGHCRPKYERNPNVQESLLDARSVRSISRFSERGRKVALRRINKLIEQFKEQQQ